MPLIIRVNMSIMHNTKIIGSEIVLSNHYQIKIFSTSYKLVVIITVSSFFNVRTRVRCWILMSSSISLFGPCPFHTTVHVIKFLHRNWVWWKNYRSEVICAGSWKRNIIHYIKQFILIITMLCGSYSTQRHIELSDTEIVSGSFSKTVYHFVTW